MAVHTGPLGELASRWRAVWEVGCGAVLDGASSLAASGMRGFVSEVVHMSVEREARPVHVPGVRVHRVERLPGEILMAGPPRSRPEVASIRGARWAESDRQAALLLVLPVQQRLMRPASLSLGELDFARACRRRGLPEPDRHVVVRTARGRVYLDVRWSAIGLVVEIDGAGHDWGLEPAGDALRQNAVTLGADLVMRIDLLGWRLRPEAYLDQVCAAHALLTRRRAA